MTNAEPATPAVASVSAASPVGAPGNGAHASRLSRHPATFQELDPHALTIGPGYGRVAFQRRRDHLAANFKADGVFVIAVSQRADGTLMVINGQHRVLSARDVGLPTVACYVYQGLTLEDEAAMYDLFADEMAHDRLDRFGARVTAGDPTALAVYQQALDLGLGFAFTKYGDDYQVGPLRAVGQYEKIIKQPGGAARLHGALEIIRDAFGDGRNFDAGIVQGMAIVMQRYADVFSRHGPRRERLVQRLREATLAELRATVRQKLVKRVGAPSVTTAVAWAEAFRDTYNYRLPESSRLGPWQTAGHQRERRSRPRRTGRRQAVWTAAEVEGQPD